MQKRDMATTTALQTISHRAAPTAPATPVRTPIISVIQNHGTANGLGGRLLSRIEVIGVLIKLGAATLFTCPIRPDELTVEACSVT
jgi:hypothetical protein